MRYFHKTNQKFYCPTINVENLWSLLSEEDIAKAKSQKEGAPVIDLTNKGYFKLLGKGELPKLPVIVKARFFSKGVSIN